MEQVCKEVPADYRGRFVATEDFGKDEIIAVGDSYEDVYEKAVSKGIPDPVIFAAEDKGIVNIY